MKSGARQTECSVQGSELSRSVTCSGFTVVCCCAVLWDWESGWPIGEAGFRKAGFRVGGVFSGALPFNCVLELILKMLVHRILPSQKWQAAIPFDFSRMGQTQQRSCTSMGGPHHGMKW